MGSILCGVVVYHHSTEQLAKVIESVKTQVSKILIVSNGDEIEDEFKNVSYIEIIKFDKNEGIAKALNCILSYSIKNHFDFTLTMDQDSVCSINFVKNYLENDDEQTCLFCPCIVDVNKKENLGVNNEFEYVELCITSGCMIKNDYVIKTRITFSDHYFIDFVDHDFSYKVIEAGYKIKKINSSILYHNLGKAKYLPLLSKIVGRSVYTYNHNGIRTYYYNRNAIQLMKDHPRTLSKGRFIISLIKWDLLKIIYENNKIEKIKYIFKGILDGASYKKMEK